VSTVGLFFGWPDGQVWPNLAASAISFTASAAAVWWRARVHLRRHHAAREARHDELRADLAALRALLTPAPPGEDP